MSESETESDEFDEEPTTEFVRDENFSEDEGTASDEIYMSDDFEFSSVRAELYENSDNVCMVKPPEVLEPALSVLKEPVSTSYAKRMCQLHHL